MSRATVTRQVFISHASQDASIAREVVAALEEHGVACWISARDVPPGANYQEAIVEAIGTARALVLLLTEAANGSDEVKKELSLASAQGVAVYPVRLGTVQPNPALRYELATRQWIEGGDTPAIAARLAASIQGGVPTTTQGEPVPALALPDKPSLAVLPFQNMSGDPEQEYFADGMVEDITTALSRTGWLFVIGRNSSFAYKGRSPDLRAVGRELGVRYVLEGSVRRAGGRVRITCQLIEAAGGHHVWADRFDGALDDIFELQDRVTESVVGAIEPSLRRAEIDRATRKPTGSLDAYDLYLRALHWFERLSPTDAALALDLLRQAIALDGNFALAKATAAFQTGMAAGMWWVQRDSPAAVEAVRLAREALLQAPDDPATLRLAGFAVTFLAGDRASGRRALERAMLLSPHSAPVLFSAALVALFCGECEAARDRFARAMRISPLDSDMHFYHLGMGIALIETGPPERALEHLQRAGAGRPDTKRAGPPLIHCLVQLGRIEEARVRAADYEPGALIAGVRHSMSCFVPEMIERRIAALKLAGATE